MFSVRLIWFISFYYVRLGALDFVSVQDQMYANIRADNPCFLRLNGTNRFGCTSSRFGNVGTLHLVLNSTDLNWLLNEGMADPYTVALIPTMFNRKVLESIESCKVVNGVILLINITNREVMQDLQTHGFSPEDTCPNRYSDMNSCPSVPWNPNGTNILLESWSFPIFVIYDTNTIKDITDCFYKYNLPLNNQNDRSLCALELKSHMYAAVDSKTCMRRTEMSYQNIRPIKFCDPLGDKNIYWSLKELKPETSNKSVAIVAARLDATSMFQDLTPGVLSAATSIVTLMATANLVSEMITYDEANNYSNNIMFILFNGEAYDYIGSSRMVYDMLQGDFPNNIIKFNKEHIGLYVELSQIHYEKEVIFHNPTKYNASENIISFMDMFKTRLVKYDFKIGTSNITSIPPASIHSFLKNNPNFPGIVLTGFNEQFKNKFYHSILDDIDNIQYNKTAQTIASISTSLSYSLYTFLTNTSYNGTKQANTTYVTELLNCYVKSINCEVFQSLTSPLQLPDSPPNYYISIDSITNTLTSLSRLLLASFGSKKINSILNEEDCIKYQTTQGFIPIWLRGKYNACYSTTSNFTDAVSPAFVISDYDLSSPEYSTWTESVWHETQIRMFLRQSHRLQIIIFIFGALIFLISFIVVRKVYAHAGTYLNNQEANSVTSC